MREQFSILTPALIPFGERCHHVPALNLSGCGSGQRIGYVYDVRHLEAGHLFATESSDRLLISIALQDYCRMDDFTILFIGNCETDGQSSMISFFEALE